MRVLALLLLLLLLVALVLARYPLRSTTAIVASDDGAFPDVIFRIGGTSTSLYNMTRDSIVVLFVASPFSDHDSTVKIERELLSPLYDKYRTYDSSYTRRVQAWKVRGWHGRVWSAMRRSDHAPPVRIISVGQMQSLETQEFMTQFATTNGFKWPHVANTDAVARKCGINRLPVLFIIDRSHTAHSRLEAEQLEVASAADIDALVQQAIADSNASKQSEDSPDLWLGRLARRRSGATTTTTTTTTAAMTTMPTTTMPTTTPPPPNDASEPSLSALISVSALVVAVVLGVGWFVVRFVRR